MPTETLQVVRRYLRRHTRLHREWDNARILERYVEHEDADAFALLVERHGPMVLGVCRRVLGQMADAEDAFQATFLIFARQARSIRKSNNVAAWLHRVAYRTARRARFRNSAESAEGHAPVLSDDDPAANVVWREIREVLDEELNRLPKRLRGPLVHCYLDGQTRDEAATHLGLSLGTLKRRLESGRRLLKRRLQVRGITTVGLAAAVLAPAGLRANVAPKMLWKTTKLATSCRTEVVPANVLSLVQGTVHVMNSPSPKLWVAALVVAVGLIAGGITAFTGGATEQIAGKSKNDSANQQIEKPPLGQKHRRTDSHGDPLPPEAIQRFGTLRFRQGGGFCHAVVSPDGRTIATASYNRIRLFDLKTGKHIRVFENAGTPNSFNSNYSLVSFSPDGKTIANVSGGWTAMLWDVESGKKLRRIGEPFRFTTGLVPVPRPGAPVKKWPYQISNVRFVRGGLLASGHGAGGRLLDPKTGKIVCEVATAGRIIGRSPNGKTLIALNGHGGELVLHDVESRRTIRRFSGIGKAFTAVLSSDGKTLVAGTSAAELLVWNVETGTRVHRIQARDAKEGRQISLTKLGIALDNKTLFAGTRYGKILRWDLTTGKELLPYRGHTGDRVVALLFPPDGKILVSLGWDRVIRRWELTTGRQLPTGDGYDNHVVAVISPDGRYAVMGDQAGRFDVWETATGKRVRSLRKSGPNVNLLAFRPDGKLLAASQSDNRVTFWDTTAWREVGAIHLPKKNESSRGSWFSDLVFSPDGRFLLTSCAHDGTRLWDVSARREVWRQPRNGHAAFSPDGKTIACTEGSVLHIRDAVTGQNVSSKIIEQKRGGDITDVAFSPNGDVLATCHRDGTIRFRDPATGKERKRLQNSKSVIWSISFSPEGNWLLATNNGHSLRLYEVITGQQILHRDGHSGYVYYGQYGPDGKTALTTALDLTSLLWTLRPDGVPVAKGNLESLWKNLRSEEAVTAYRAAWALLDDPDTAIKLLRRKIPPAKPRAEKATLLKWLSDLDDERFRTRERAARSLTKQGSTIVPLLRTSLAKAKSLEQRMRIEQLVSELERPPTPEDYRIRRSVQIIELCRKPAGRQLLREWANGARQMPLTRLARAALHRQVDR